MFLTDKRESNFYHSDYFKFYNIRYLVYNFYKLKPIKRVTKNLTNNFRKIWLIF